MKSITHFCFTSLIIISLTACGFHLRGATDVPFESIFIQGQTLTISKGLRQSLTTSKVAIMPAVKGADLQLELVGEDREKRILSLGGTGTVNEYELYYRVYYRTKFAGQTIWTPVSTLESRRDFTYSDSTLLAKQTEEAKLYESMQRDTISNLMRRLSLLKKPE